jgi:hypothetical protein
MFSIERPSVAKRHLKPGLRPLGALFAAVALLLGLAGPAAAESQTIPGTGVVPGTVGDLEKLFVSNGSTSVVAKAYGSDIECGVSRWVSIVMRDGDGTRYTAMGGCYPGDPASGGGWHKSLSRGNTLVNCSGFTLRYNSTGGYWRFEVPRSCLGRLANRIKVVTAELNSGSPNPGLAGPTRWLSRG